MQAFIEDQAFGGRDKDREFEDPPQEAAVFWVDREEAKALGGIEGDREQATKNQGEGGRLAGLGGILDKVTDRA